MPPLHIELDTGTYGFRDASTTSRSNPSEFVRQEAEKLWKEESIVLVSLGTDFSSLAPAKPTPAWSPDEAYLKPFADEILLKASSLPTTLDRSRRVIDVASYLVSLAAEMEAVHLKASTTISSK